MKSKNEFKKIDIKNCVCRYFDDIVNCTNTKFINILLDKKFENISVYETFYKTSTGLKPLHIRFDKIDGFVMVLDGKIYG